MLALWNGFDRSLAHDLRRMDRLFAGLDRRPTFRAPAWPRVMVDETESAFEVQAEVPGFSAEDITVTLHEGELKIEGRTKEAEPVEGRTSLRQERRRVSFTRTFGVGIEIDEANVSAVVKDGLLTITLPKAPEVQPKTIAVVAA